MLNVRKFFRNASYALRNPEHMLGYAQYCLSRAFHGTATRTLHSIEIGNLRSYSEWTALSEVLEESEKRFLRNRSIEGGPIFDIGANVGLLSIYLAKVFPQSRVFAFEPAPRTFASLKRNVTRNGVSNVEIVQAAVTTQCGEVGFRIMPGSSATCHIDDNETEMRVNAISVDSFCAKRDIQHVPLIKIDVEGFEEEVLAGASKLLADHCVDIVYYEVCPRNCSITGHDVRVPSAMLRQNGYILHRLNPDGSLEPIQSPDPTSVTGFTNWVAVSPRVLLRCYH